MLFTTLEIQDLPLQNKVKIYHDFPRRGRPLRHRPGPLRGVWQGRAFGGGNHHGDIVMDMY